MKAKSSFKSNSISPVTNAIFNLLFIIYCVLCMAPLVLVFMVSITSENSLVTNGYSFFPTEISFSTYKYLFMDTEKLLRAYGITIGACVIGTFFSVLLTMLYAYPISRKSFKYRNFFSFFMFFTMLFQGGLVPWYILYTKYLHLQNNPAVLVIPALLNAFNVLIMKTFFSTNLPDSILESARIDGASEFRIFYSIVIPLSTLQYSMYKALRSVEFLTSSHAVSIGNATSELAKLPAETLRMAMAILGIGPIVFAYPFFQKYFIKGLTIGAVKG